MWSKKSSEPCVWTIELFLEVASSPNKISSNPWHKKQLLFLNFFKSLSQKTTAFLVVGASLWHNMTTRAVVYLFSVHRNTLVLSEGFSCPREEFRITRTVTRLPAELLGHQPSFQNVICFEWGASLPTGRHGLRMSAEKARCSRLLMVPPPTVGVPHSPNRTDCAPLSPIIRCWWQCSITELSKLFSSRQVRTMHNPTIKWLYWYSRDICVILLPKCTPYGYMVVKVLRTVRFHNRSI